MYRHVDNEFDPTSTSVLLFGGCSRRLQRQYFDVLCAAVAIWRCSGPSRCPMRSRSSEWTRADVRHDGRRGWFVHRRPRRIRRHASAACRARRNSCDRWLITRTSAGPRSPSIRCRSRVAAALRPRTVREPPVGAQANGFRQAILELWIRKGARSAAAAYAGPDRPSCIRTSPPSPRPGSILLRDDAADHEAGAGEEVRMTASCATTSLAAQPTLPQRAAAPGAGSSMQPAIAGRDASSAESGRMRCHLPGAPAPARSTPSDPVGTSPVPATHRPARTCPTQPRRPTLTVPDQPGPAIPAAARSRPATWARSAARLAPTATHTSDFSCAIRRSGQRQTGHVRVRDEEHASDRSE